MITTSKAGVNRLWCDGCNRRIASASKMEKLIAKADAARAVQGEMDLCVVCAQDPAAARIRMEQHTAFLAKLGWTS